MTDVKTAETIESQTQPESLFTELPNNAENQRVVAEMSMLDELTAEAARLAEAQTQPAGLDTGVDSVEVETAKMAGHCAKRLAVAAGEVRTAGQKDVRSTSTTVQTQPLKVKLQGMDLMKWAKQFDRNNIRTLTCYSK